MNRSRRELLLTLAAGAGPLLLGLAVDRQGFNLLDDGLWVLGARVLGSGGLPYRDLFSIYGPARYLLLWPLTWLFGPSALALAVLKALATGAAAAVAFAFARRLGAGRWAWLVPAGAAALGPFDPRYVAVAWLAWLLSRPAEAGEPGPAGASGRPAPRPRRFAALGMAGGAVALFGVDALLYTSVVALGAFYGPVAAARIALRPAREPDATSAASAAPAAPATPYLAEALGFAFGGVAVLAVAWLVAIATGAAGAAWWDTVVYPLARFRPAMGIPWWQTFRAAPELGRPFALLETGETLPAAWPGHAAGVTLGVRALFVGLALIPVLGLRRCLRGGGAPWCAATALALGGWLTMSGRGGVEHLKLAWLGSLVLLPGLLGSSLSPRKGQDPFVKWASVAALVVALSGWATFLGENLWLAAHAGRPGLTRWDLRGAQVLVSADRARTTARVAALVDSLSPPPAPILVWPAQPGLNVVLGRPPATPQATLLAGEVRDPAAVIAGLEARPPRVAVVGRSRGLVAGKLTLRSLSPPLWYWLRGRYAVVESIRRDPDEYWILARAPGGPREILARPLDERLPDVEARLLDASLTLAGPGHTIGQTMRVGPDGLAGLQVRAVIERGPVRLPLRLRVWGRAADGRFTQPLGELAQPFEVTENLQKIGWAFAPITGTAGREILWTVELLEDHGPPVALGCHRYDPSDPRGDAYPEGTAQQDGRPLPADLYFLSY